MRILNSIVMKNWYRYILVFLFLGLVIQCSHERAVVGYAKQMLYDGKFERALELINRVDSLHNSADIDGVRGRILSLEPATMVDGMFLMNKVVDELDQGDLRKELFQFYLDTGLDAKAADLVSGERIGPELFFRRDMVGLRSVVRCFELPSILAAKQIIETTTSSKEEPTINSAYVKDDAYFFAMQCLAKGIRDRSNDFHLYWLLDSQAEEARVKALPVMQQSAIKPFVAEFSLLFFAHDDSSNSENQKQDPVFINQLRNRCQMLARLGQPQNLFSDEWLSADAAQKWNQAIADCKTRFPGSLVLHRSWPIDLTSVDSVRSGAILFDESVFFPPYNPRAEFEPLAEDSLPDIVP